MVLINAMVFQNDAGGDDKHLPVRTTILWMDKNERIVTFLNEYMYNITEAHICSFFCLVTSQ